MWLVWNGYGSETGSRWNLGRRGFGVHEALGVARRRGRIGTARMLAPHGGTLGRAAEGWRAGQPRLSGSKRLGGGSTVGPGPERSGGDASEAQAWRCNRARGLRSNIFCSWAIAGGLSDWHGDGIELCVNLRSLKAGRTPALRDNWHLLARARIKSKPKLTGSFPCQIRSKVWPDLRSPRRCRSRLAMGRHPADAVLRRRLGVPLYVGA